MQGTQVQEIFDWLKPSPLWRDDGSDLGNGDLFKPRLLTFASDQFIDDFLAIAKQSQRAAPAALSPAILGAPADNSAVRLYQPAHGVFYLVCASLCCRQAGFPDRVVNRATGDKTSFVLRKVLPDNSELGWIGPAQKKAWTPIGTPGATVPGAEDRLPLLTAKMQDGRTLLYGYVPVASRETYAAGKTDLSDSTPQTQKDLRVQEFGSRFTGNFVPAPGSANAPLLQMPANQTLLISLNILVDLLDYFAQYIPNVAAALSSTAAAPLSPNETAIIAFLNATQLTTIPSILTLGDALRSLATQRTAVDAALSQSQIPPGFSTGFDLSTFVKQKNLDDISALRQPYTSLTAFASGLNAAVVAALPTATITFNLPKLAGNDTYILRLVYERTACIPLQQWLSRRTDPFELAGFFDPDAPARPVRIPLPGDISLAGLRKFKKNVSVIMSPGMRQKMQTIIGKEVLDGTIGSGDGLDIAFVCSFSLQIIFLVAFMLLIVFVFVLNIVFFWLPFFKICFPVPKKLAPK